MAPRTVYANLQDGLQNLSLWDQSLADMGNLGMIPCAATGSNAVTLTPMASAFAPNISSPPQQLQNFTFVAAATSTGSVTINGLKLYKEDGVTQAGANDLLINVLYGIVYNSALNTGAGGYQIAFPVTSIVNPVISGATITGSTITTSTYNGNTWTAGTGTLTIAAAKTLTANNSITLAGTDGKSATFSNSLTFAGTDGTVMTFPTTSATIARTDAANTFTGTQTVGSLVATTVNGNTFTAGTYTLTGTAAKTLNFTNSLTLSGTDATVMTFPTTSATLARSDAANTFTGVQTFSSQPILSTLTASSAVATDGSKGLVSVTNTGSGNNVLATSPVLTTPNIGAATATTINGAALDNNAWSTYSPTVTSAIGTITTVGAVAARSKTIGKTVFVEADVTITTAGTGAGNLQVTLPTAAAAFPFVGSAREVVLTGKSGSAFIAASDTKMIAIDAAATTFIANNARIILTATYEIP